MVDLYSIHERYAKDQQEISAFLRQFHVTEVDSPYFASQTKIVDFVPKLLAMTLLLQTAQQGHWAHFTLPAEFFTIRAFGSEIAPSIGTLERIEELKERIEEFVKREKEKREKNQQQQDEEESEEECFLHLLNCVKEINLDLQYVRKRLRQFIQA